MSAAELDCYRIARKAAVPFSGAYARRHASVLSHLRDVSQMIGSRPSLHLSGKQIDADRAQHALNPR